MNEATPAGKDTFEHIDRIFKMQQARHLEIGQRPLSERKKDLRRLLKSVLKHRHDIAQALEADLGKPAIESDLSEIYPIKSDIRHAIRELNTWAAKRSFRSPLALMGTKAWVQPEPKGVVLIISPWNFPFNLTFCPLVSALAAGNCVMLKPSEATPHSSALMGKIIREVFEPDHVALIEGEVEESTYLTTLPFHHIFFTGGPEIGKKVMAAAAQNLCSVTLELGGKSPAIVDASANMKEAVRRIVWSRFFNSGQVCISPDYALVDERVYPAFIKEVKSCIASFYKDPMTSGALSKLVHDGHFSKIKQLFEDATAKGAEVITGGTFDASKRFFAPTVLSNVTNEMTVMHEEIFGPILPVISFRNPSEAIALMNSLPRPLAFYIFAKGAKNIQPFVLNSRAGSTGINETFIQFIHPELPFGGVNFSGIGKGHGKYGFDAFSNERSFVKQLFSRNAIRFIHPPYTGFTRKLATFMLKWL